MITASVISWGMSEVRAFECSLRDSDDLTLTNREEGVRDRRLVEGRAGSTMSLMMMVMMMMPSDRGTAQVLRKGSLDLELKVCTIPVCRYVRYLSTKSYLLLF